MKQDIMYTGGWDMVKKILLFLMPVMLFMVFPAKVQTVSAADSTVSIYIGDGTTSRHHMSLAAGNISNEFRYQLKGYQAKSSNYSTNASSVLQILETGTGKCKVKGLKEGTGLVVLTVKTTDGKTFTEKMFVFVYAKTGECRAAAAGETDLYRGASSNAGVETKDKKGTISDKEQVTVLGVCGDYYYIKKTDESNDRGFVQRKDLRVFVKSVKIREQNASVGIGESTRLNGEVSPGIASSPDLSWKSGNDAVVSVDASGMIKGLSEGTAMVSASSVDGSNAVGTAYVSVYTKTEEVQGYIKSDTDLYAIGNGMFPIAKGKAGTKLTVVGICGDYYRVKTDIQEVKEDYGGYCYILKAKVRIPVTEVSIDTTEIFLSPGETVQLSAAVSPELADDKSITWSSTKEKAAVVDKNGYVTAKKTGNTVIRAVSAGGLASAQCVVHVTEKKEGKQVTSKPYMEAETDGMDSIRVSASNEVTYNGMIVYVDGKQYKSHKFDEISWYHSLSCDGLRAGKTYKIKVKTYTEKDGKKTYSKMSDVRKITIGKTDMNVNITGKKEVTVSWRKMKHAKSYGIYRSGKKKGKYTRIGTVTGSRTSYKDKKVQMGKKYYYKVQAVSGSGKKVSSSIDSVKVGKLGNTERYMAGKYDFICTDSNKNINEYHIKGCYSPIKYRMAGGTLEIHVYLEFVTYVDTGKSNSSKVGIFEKKAPFVEGEISASEYITMFKTGIRKSYSGVKVKGGKGDFKQGINFDTELVIHEKNGKEKYHPEQKFVEVLIGGECPNCTKEGDHWYHSGSNNNASGYLEYGDVCTIYMPTNEQVRTNKTAKTPALDYGTTAAHELGHILGLDDAYPTEKYDRCADNSETGEKYDKARYDNLMKHHSICKEINANGIEMMLRAVDRETGIPDFGSQCFKTYGDETISDVIKNHKDYEKDKVSE